MTPRHPSVSLIGRYAGGGGGIATDELWALESHLESCGDCRRHLADLVGERAPEVSALVAGVWAELTPRLHAVPPTPQARRWVRRSATWWPPAMMSWFVTTVMATLFLVVAGHLLGAVGVTPMLLAAPVLPALGVAAAWSRGLDPAYELTISSPRAGLPLVLRRTAVVLVAVMPVLLVAGALTGISLAQWLLPSLAFTTGTLGLGSLIGMTRAAVALMSAWATVIVASSAALHDGVFALQPGSMPVWAALGALGAVLVVLRRNNYTSLAIHR
ncbi:hypothetical protein [Sinosporangium siamense]|uniref:Membrane protein n=1 Tax=Sinosporangium siamense TaxID=1367973 RepID=A0A919RN68_9ACTN|nr:hypothetical protein [Sinosporangium siamense]GII95276.1 membrane protein [Sinosporangium siamense]